MTFTKQQPATPPSHKANLPAHGGHLGSRSLIATMKSSGRNPDLPCPPCCSLLSPVGPVRRQHVYCAHNTRASQPPLLPLETKKLPTSPSNPVWHLLTSNCYHPGPLPLSAWLLMTMSLASGLPCLQTQPVILTRKLLKASHVHAKLPVPHRSLGGKVWGKTWTFPAWSFHFKANLPEQPPAGCKESTHQSSHLPNLPSRLPPILLATFKPTPASHWVV